MIGFFVWLIGLILTIRAAIEIWHLPVTVEKRLIVIALILISSWLGLLFYYFYARDRLASWLN